jgi:hypothetical protein
MQSALKLIPASHALMELDGAGHDLQIKKTFGELPLRVVSEFQTFVRELVK